MLLAIGDASLVASAMRIYLFTQPPNKVEKHASLIFGKSQIAKLKEIGEDALSVPRMECNAAWLGASAILALLQSLEIRIQRTVLLTDSETVYHWANANPLYMSKFIGNKTKLIQSAFNKNNIFHLPSQHNIVDYDSKWQPDISCESQEKHSTGDWVKLPLSEWPVSQPKLGKNLVSSLPEVLSTFNSGNINIFNDVGNFLLPSTKSQRPQLSDSQISQAFHFEPRLYQMSPNLRLENKKDPYLAISAWLINLLIDPNLYDSTSENTI